MARAFGFELLDTKLGAIFQLSAPATETRTFRFENWKAELREGVPFICVRGETPSTSSRENIVRQTHEVAENALDILAVEDRQALIIQNPMDGVVWRVGEHGLKIDLSTSIVFATAGLPLKLVVRDAAGNVLPDIQYTPPAYNNAFRYFRYSQAASNVFDAYRNMFLALECLLDHIDGKQHGDNETGWLGRALTSAVQQHGCDLAPFSKSTATDPVQSFLDSHYSAVRCALFHSKSSVSNSLRPGSLDSREQVLHQLLLVQGLVEHILKSMAGVRLTTSGFTHSGFGHFLEKLAPHTHLLVASTTCPTIEQILQRTGESGGGSEHEAEYDEFNSDTGAIQKVTFDGLRPGTTDEWTFVAEFKRSDLALTHIGTLRLASHVDRSAMGAEAMFVVPMMEKMSGTLHTTDLDIDGANKLIIRVRCVLRNERSQRRDFTS
ncbi:MAG: hypothetical protein JNN30_06190 [Rhodanobacteraceae bacterium]|nr:hypothetical protein [Rhodanobacteraceae bacterium]